MVVWCWLVMHPIVVAGWVALILPEPECVEAQSAIPKLIPRIKQSVFVAFAAIAIEHCEHPMPTQFDSRLTFVPTKYFPRPI